MTKDARWFHHDSNAAHDPKMLRLRAKWGLEGYGAFWLLAEIMHDQADGRILRSDVPVWAAELRFDKLADFVADCCDFGLLQCDDDAVWSDRMLREKARLEAVLERASLGGRARAAKLRKVQVAQQVEAQGDVQRDKRDREIRKKEYAPAVNMTPEEYGKLVADYGEKGAKACVEKLSAYKGANGKRYKSDYLAIRNWVTAALKLPPAATAREGPKCKACGTAFAGTEGFLPQVRRGQGESMSIAMGWDGTIGGRTHGYEDRSENDGPEMGACHIGRRQGTNPNSANSRIMALYDEGVGIEGICGRTGIARRTVVNALRRNGVRWSKHRPMGVR